MLFSTWSSPRRSAGCVPTHRKGISRGCARHSSRTRPSPARRQSILADALEAIFGAVYIDGGFAKAKEVVGQVFAERLQSLPDVDDLRDPKTRLQEWLQARKMDLPAYELVDVSGADHAQRFVASCTVDALSQTTEGEASSRRKAEQKAAVAMLQVLLGERP